MRGRKVTSALVFSCALCAVSSAAGDAATVRAPLVCSKGPSGQRFEGAITLPRVAAEGATYSVRIDGASSGEISHFGLRYIHDMSTAFALPTGAAYVSGSLRVVPGTGTPNVAAGALVAYEAGVVRLVLPGHVESGSSYTPPSIELRLRVDASAGAALPIALLDYRVTAKAVIVGDVLTICEPDPKPYVLGTTLVASPEPP